MNGVRELVEVVVVDRKRDVVDHALEQDQFGGTRVVYVHTHLVRDLEVRANLCHDLQLVFVQVRRVELPEVDFFYSCVA